MQAVLLAEVQRTINPLRKTAICSQPLAIVENGNGKFWTLSKTEERDLQYIQKNRVVWVGKDLRNHPVPTACQGQGHFHLSALFSLALYSPEDGPSTISDNLLQCLTT